MNEYEIRDNLCCYDERSPDYGDLLISNGGDPRELPQPRVDCGCDNCFYGRDGLAVELLLNYGHGKCTSLNDLIKADKMPKVYAMLKDRAAKIK